MFSDLLKIILGALLALVFKEAFDRLHLGVKERQTRWLPLLRAAQDLREKLLDLIPHYKSPKSQWNDHWWKDSRDVWRPLAMEARDFHELYLLDINAARIEDFNGQPIDPTERRSDKDAVRRVKMRVHELNRATVVMYKTAAYLGYAQRMRRELPHGRLLIDPATQQEVIGLLEAVRKDLNGTSGAGFVDDLQDLLGESVWGPEDNVIGYHAFRERIFSEAGWEQLNELFRFFLHFHYKMDYEVKNTIDALASLCDALGGIVKPGWRWRTRLGNSLRERPMAPASSMSDRMLAIVMPTLSLWPRLVVSDRRLRWRSSRPGG